MTRCALYRHFDADGVLLYVGMSSDPARRLVQHYAGSAWADEIANMSVDWFDTRSEAIAAEVNAIQNDRPAHNNRHQSYRAVENPGYSFRRGFVAAMGKTNASVLDIERATGCSRHGLYKLLKRESATTTAENAILIAKFFDSTVEEMSKPANKSGGSA